MPRKKKIRAQSDNSPGRWVDLFLLSKYEKRAFINMIYGLVPYGVDGIIGSTYYRIVGVDGDKFICHKAMYADGIKMRITADRFRIFINYEKQALMMMNLETISGRFDQLISATLKEKLKTETV